MVHALGWYFPESRGGTEAYVEGLVQHLNACDVDSMILAPSATEATADYQWNGTAVHRYRVSDPTKKELAQALPHGGIGEFESFLRLQHGDVYHQHSWTRGCGLAHLRVAKSLGLNAVVTIHVPGAVCLRGTMMLDGERPCDGMVDVARCSRCWGVSRGVPTALARWQGHHPDASDVLGRMIPASRARTAMLTPTLVRRRQREIAELGQIADRVVAVSHWLYETLAINGVPSDKLVYCEQGVNLPERLSAGREASGDVLRVGFLGRWDPIKGVDVLVEAFRKLPAGCKAELFVHGLPFDEAYEGHVRRLAHGESRVHIVEPVGRHDLSRVLSGFDVLGVPSLWLETGPLVVLEAFAVGTPVLGSDLGGIAELVQPGVGGLLLPPGDVAAWTQALLELATDLPSTRRRFNPPVPSSSRRVAVEMAAIYRELLSSNRQAIADTQTVGVESNS